MLGVVDVVKLKDVRDGRRKSWLLSVAIDLQGNALHTCIRPIGAQLFVRHGVNRNLRALISSRFNTLNGLPSAVPYADKHWRRPFGGNHKISMMF